MHVLLVALAHHVEAELDLVGGDAAAGLDKALPEELLHLGEGEGLGFGLGQGWA